MRRAFQRVRQDGHQEFATGLHDPGFARSTGGTQKALEAAAARDQRVGNYRFRNAWTAREDAHPAIHAGILAMRETGAYGAGKRLGVGLIDIVAVNLYPFKATILSPTTLEEAIENIDIGGPTMPRAAAKTGRTSRPSDPADYGRID